jgi:hypothetical protein
MNENFKSSKFKLDEFKKYSLNYSKKGDLVAYGVGILKQHNSKNAELNLNYELVSHALNYLKKRHPILRASLEFKEENEAYLNVNDYGDSDMRKNELEWSRSASGSDLITDLEAYLKQNFSYTEKCLLWKCKVIHFNENNHEKYAICMVLPVISDGTNILGLIIELVNIVNALRDNLVCDEMREEIELPSNLNDFLDYKHYSLPQNYKGEISENSNNFNLDQNFTKNDSSGFELNLVRISKEKACKILALCNEKHVNLTSFMSAQVLKSLNELYKENNLKFPINFSCLLPINLKIHFQPHLDFNHIGYHTHSTRIDLDFESQSQLENVIENSNYIAKQIQNKINFEHGFLSLLFDDYEYKASLNRVFDQMSIKELVEMKRSDLAITNIGSWIYTNKQPNKGEFELCETYFGDTTNSKHSISPALKFFISFWNNELQISISSNKSSIESKYTQRLIEIFKNCFFSS